MTTHDAPYGAKEQRENVAGDASTTGGAVGRRVDIQMGALAPRFAEQPFAGFLTPHDLGKFQAIADALTMAIVHGVLPMATGNKARDRLAKKIIRALKSPSRSDRTLSDNPHPRD